MHLGLLDALDVTLVLEIVHVLFILLREFSAVVVVDLRDGNVWHVSADIDLRPAANHHRALARSVCSEVRSLVAEMPRHLIHVGRGLRELILRGQHRLRLELRGEGAGARRSRHEILLIQTILGAAHVDAVAMVIARRVEAVPIRAIRVDVWILVAVACA